MVVVIRYQAFLVSFAAFEHSRGYTGFCGIEKEKRVNM